jgi:hypothetical protein
MYVLNLRALITDLKKHKLSASDQRKYFWNLFFSYSLFLLLPVIYLLRIEQNLLALSLTGVQVAILLLASGLRYRTLRNQSSISSGSQFSAVAFVQLVRILFLIILEVAMLAIVALIIGAIVFLVYKLGELPSLAGYNLLDHRLMAGLLLILIILSGFLIFKLIFASLFNSKWAKFLDQKIKLFFNEQEFSILNSPVILSRYLNRWNYCNCCGNPKCSVWRRCQYGQRFNIRFVAALFVLSLIYFTIIFYYPYPNYNYAPIVLCISLILFQLFWLRQVNLALSEVR